MDHDLIPNKIFDWSKPEKKEDINFYNKSLDIRRKNQNLNSDSAQEVVRSIFNFKGKNNFISECS